MMIEQELHNAVEISKNAMQALENERAQLHDVLSHVRPHNLLFCTLNHSEAEQHTPIAQSFSIRTKMRDVEEARHRTELDLEVIHRFRWVWTSTHSAGCIARYN